MFATQTFSTSLVCLGVFLVGGVLSIFLKVFFFFLYEPQVDPFSYSFLILLSACRMTRGCKEVLTSQVGRKKGTPQETPTTSSLVVAMCTKELRSLIQILIEISLETSDGAATSTFGEADNAVYFTRE